MSTWLPSALLALFSAPAALDLSLAEPDRTQPAHSLILLSLATYQAHTGLDTSPQPSLVAKW